MLRYSRKNDSEGDIKQNGFTIIELIVVMGIIAVISGISVAGLATSRNQVYYGYVTDRIQSEIRNQFIGSIAVEKISGSGSCSGQVPKVRSVEIEKSTDFTSFRVRKFCENSTGNGLIEANSVTVDIPKEVGFKRTLSSSLAVGTDPNVTKVNLVFTSPDGRFYPFTESFNPPDPLSGWTKNPFTLGWDPPSGSNAATVLTLSANGHLVSTLTTDIYGNVTK